jgi:hypothetical protein
MGRLTKKAGGDKFGGLKRANPTPQIRALFSFWA